VRGDHRHRRHCGHADRLDPAERTGHPWPSSAEDAADLVYRYGLFETLDHFYSSIDDAMLAIGSEEAGESTSSPE
jgi:hypothetical protein